MGTIGKLFQLGGLDLSSSELSRSPAKARSMLNFDRSRTGSAVARQGYKILTETNGILGLHKYTYTDDTADSILGPQSELIVIDDYMDRITTGQISIDYSGSATTATVSIIVESGEWKCILKEDGSEVLNSNLKTGFDEASIVDLSDLETAVDAVSDWTMTIDSGSSTHPAAFLPTTVDLDAKGSSAEITFYEPERIFSDDAFGAHFTEDIADKNDDQFRPASTVNMNDVMYVVTGIRRPRKYDGQNFYFAGLDQVGDLGSPSYGTGSLNGTYKYIATYVQVDHRGNIVEGVESASMTATPSTQSVQFTIPQINVDTDGFNTNFAKADSADTNVNTISADDGAGGDHSLNVGDEVYFLDESDSTYKTRNVTASTASTFTIDGDPIDVANNTIFSIGTKIAIYRTKANGSDYFLIAEIANDPSQATQSYEDDTADANLGAQYLFPEAGREHTRPPSNDDAPKYAAVYRDLLVLAGSPLNPNEVIYSDTDSPEYFPVLNVLKYRRKTMTFSRVSLQALSSFLYLKTILLTSLRATLLPALFALTVLALLLGVLLIIQFKELMIQSFGSPTKASTHQTVVQPQ